MQETLNWQTDSTVLPQQNKYVLIAAELRVALGYYDREQGWYWEDGGGVASPVDAWAAMPCGPYTKTQLSDDIE